MCVWCVCVGDAGDGTQILKHYILSSHSLPPKLLVVACSDIVTNPEHMLPLSHIPGPLPYILQGREMLMDLLLGITFFSVAVDDPSFAHERSETGIPTSTYLAFLNDSGNCLSPHPAFVS